MKTYFTIFFIFFSIMANAQKVDSIYFHLYTDSLKKEVHNYINVDGKYSNGRYLPLDNSQILFSSNTGVWVGNNLIINKNYIADSVVIKAVLKETPTVFKTIIIYIKKVPDPEKLKTEAEILNEVKKKGNLR